MTVVEFRSAAGVVLGEVRVTDRLDADPPVASVAATWLRRGRPAAEFAAYYDGWANGYASARVTQR